MASITRVVVGALLLVLGACAGQTPSGASAFKPVAGDYAVDVADIVMRDNEQKKELQLRVASPSAKGQFPVIVLSHGGGSSKDGYVKVADHWASHGYVVIAPTHMDSKSLGFDIAKAGGAGMTAVTLSRLADMTFIARHMPDIGRRVPGLSDKMDASKLVAAGHSMGGATAMVSAGVRLKNKADGSMLEMPDAGYKYLLLLSESGANPVMPDEPWRQSPVPTFIYTGTNDKGTESTGRKSPFGYNLVDHSAASAQPRHYLWVNDVDHYLGGLWCTADVPGPLDHDGLNIFNGVSTAFLDAYTKNDKSALKFLKTGDLGSLTKARATLSMK